MLKIIQDFLEEYLLSPDGKRIKDLVRQDLLREVLKYLNDSLVNKFISETVWEKDKKRIDEITFSEFSKKFIIRAEDTSYIVSSEEISDIVEFGGIEVERINLYLVK